MARRNTFTQGLRVMLQTADDLVHCGTVRSSKCCCRLLADRFASVWDPDLTYAALKEAVESGGRGGPFTFRLDGPQPTLVLEVDLSPERVRRMLTEHLVALVLLDFQNMRLCMRDESSDVFGFVGMPFDLRPREREAVLQRVHPSWDLLRVDSVSRDFRRYVFSVSRITVEALAKKHGVSVLWRPFYLSAEMPEESRKE